MRGAYEPHISIIICVHTVRRDVVNMLEGLSVRPFDEVLVICTGPSGMLQQLHDSIGLSLVERLRLRLIQAPCGCGASVGRNVGIDNASGDVLLFLDSDILCASDIADRHRQYYVDKSVVAAAGPVSLAPNSRNWGLVNNAVLRSKYFSAFGPDSSGDIEWAPSANLSARRDIAALLKFDEIFPIRGGGEDIDFCWRARAHGRIVRVPAAMAHHIVWDTHSILPRLFRWGWAHALLLRGHPDRAFTSIGSIPELFLLALVSVVIGFFFGQPWFAANVMILSVFLVAVVVLHAVKGRPLGSLFECVHDMGLMCGLMCSRQLWFGRRICIDRNQEKSVRRSGKVLLRLYGVIAVVVYVLATLGYV